MPESVTQAGENAVKSAEASLALIDAFEAEMNLYFNNEPTEENTEPTEEITEPTEEITEPTEENTEPTEENTEPPEEITEPTENSTEPNPTSDPGNSSVVYKLSTALLLVILAAKLF